MNTQYPKVWVYGTRDRQWHFVGPEDRDYVFGLTTEFFERVGPEAAIKFYLRLGRVRTINIQGGAYE